MRNSGREPPIRMGRSLSPVGDHVNSTPDGPRPTVNPSGKTPSAWMAHGWIAQTNNRDSKFPVVLKRLNIVTAVSSLFVTFFCFLQSCGQCNVVASAKSWPDPIFLCFSPSIRFVPFNRATTLLVLMYSPVRGRLDFTNRPLSFGRYAVGWCL
jgi:hypothetical protein